MMSSRRIVLHAVAAALLLACSSSKETPAPAPAVDAGTDVETPPPEDASAEADAPIAPCAERGPTGLRTLKCEGLTLALNVPESCPSAGCGLIVDFHGALMNADAEDAHTEMRARGAAKGYVVAQPTGHTHTIGIATGNMWFNVEDDAVFRLVTALVRDLGIDRSRVHAMGFSQGGYISLRMMCKHADLFASVAPGNAGYDDCALEAKDVAACAMKEGAMPSRPIDVLFLYGRQDAVIPPQCGVQQIDAIKAAWSLGEPQTIASDSTYARKRYQGSGVVLETLDHDYVAKPGTLESSMGHCIPGSSASSGAIWDGFACTPPNSFTWAVEVLSFFESHPRPPPQ